PPAGLGLDRQRQAPRDPARPPFEIAHRVAQRSRGRMALYARDDLHARPDAMARVQPGSATDDARGLTCASCACVAVALRLARGAAPAWARAPRTSGSTAPAP